MTTCKACGRSVRKSCRALVLGLGAGLVCADCAGKSILVCAPVRPVVEKTIERSSEDVECALRSLRTLRNACDDDRRAEGLDQAIQVLTRGRS